MFINTKYRTHDTEIMDDFAMEGEILKEALDKIAQINQLLGGNKLTLNGVKLLLHKQPTLSVLKIVDVGCGNGDMLRKLSAFALKNGFNFELIGVDANQFTINHAKKLSVNYPNINYICTDIFDKPFQNINYDIVLCTLTLHHFKEQEIEDLLTIFYKNSTIGIVINDLQRSAISFRLFQILCIVFNLNKMSKQDGLTSILRGFKKQELIDYSNKMDFKNFKVDWKWAFRYQWIIRK